MDTGAFRVKTASYEQTLAFGAYLAAYLQAGDFVALYGGLGAGKTCLTQGLAQGLGFQGPVTSPTFTLLHLYEGGRLPVYHFDAYRLSSPHELEGLGYEEYFYGDGVCVMEWSDLVPAYLPAHSIHIKIERKPAEAICVRPDAEPVDVRCEPRLITAALCAGDESRQEDFCRRMRAYADTGH